MNNGDCAPLRCGVILTQQEPTVNRKISPGKKRRAPGKLRVAGHKAARTRRLRAAGRKAALTRKRRAAARKAAAVRAASRP